MAARARILLLFLLLSVRSTYSAITVDISGPRVNTSFEFSSLFGTPFANVPLNGIKGAVYHFPNVSSSCGPYPPPTYPSLPVTNVSFIIVSNYSQCILEKVNFAKLAGYDALLAYQENDTNTTISNALVATDFSVVILTQSIASVIIENGTVLSEDDPTVVTLAADIVLGILVVMFTFIILICLCCMGVVWIFLCCRMTSHEARLRHQFRRMEEDRNDPRRRELIESLLRHLAELESSLGLQVPLGQSQADTLPTRSFQKGKEHHETCSVCVEEFEEGVLVKVLPCQHIFHPQCIDQWLANYSSVCPMCKADIRRQRGSQNIATSDKDEDASRNESDQALVTPRSQSRAYGSVTSD